MTGVAIANGHSWRVETRWEPRRCVVRDRDGHPCSQKHDHTGSHLAFGKVWNQ